MPKMRIHEVAKQLNKTSKEIISALRQNGIEVQSHMSTITDESIDKVKRTFGLDKGAEKKEAPAKKEPVAEKKPEPSVIRPEAARPAAPARPRPEGDRRTTPGRTPAEGEKRTGVRTRSEAERKSVNRESGERGRTGEARPGMKERRPGDIRTRESREGGRIYIRDNREGGRIYTRDSRDGRIYTRDNRNADSQNRQPRSGEGGRGFNRDGRNAEGGRSMNREGRPAEGSRSFNRDSRNADGSRSFTRDNRNTDGSRGINRSRDGRNAEGGRNFNRDGRNTEGSRNAGRDGRNADGSRSFNRDGRNADGGRGAGRDGRNSDGGNRNFGNRERSRKPVMEAEGAIATKDSRSDKGNRHDINREYNRENSNRENSRNSDGANRGGRNNRKNNTKKDDFNKNNVSRKPKAVKKPAPVAPPKKEEPKEEVIRNITLPDPVSLKDLAEACKVAPAAIIKKLFLGGKMVTINTEFSFEEAAEMALEYNCIAEEEVKVDVIEELLKEEDEDESKMERRPPVICVMGHVDHGKTSLLDRIRSTHVTAGEAGGITQHIGAYVVDINGEKITFLDTPGHEAFTSMRLRGAQATDIAVLVVAADAGVMPQTIEAINHAKAAGVEVIVAVNKIDKEGANVDRVKQELTEYGLIAEDWGGSTVFVPVSAKTGEGIEDLLEMITLTAEVMELKANPKRKARGLVIEAKLDKGRGPVATILIQKGTLHVGDTISIGHAFGRVRAMIDDKGDRLKSAGPSVPVEILGLNDVPFSGEVMIAHGNEKEARAYADEFIAYGREKMLEDTKSRLSLDDLFDQIQAGNVKELNLIVKADVQGSVEAVKQSLVKLSNEEVMIKVIHGAVGAINESDVTLASASNAIIIGFNVRPDSMAKTVAEQEKVDMRLYRVIYNAIEDIEAAMKGMLDPVFEEKIIGHLEIRQIYKASGVGTIAGCYVLDGIVTRSAQVRIVRDGIVIYEGTLASLKRFKDDVKEVKSGFECGLVFEKYNDVKEGDHVECFVMEEIPR